MGNPAGVKRDFEALEKRRREAIRLVTVEKLNQSEAARRVKVVRQTVGRWVRGHRQNGEAALARAERAGRKPRLTDEQREELVERLRLGPQRMGYETPLWTCPRVAHLIEQEFGIRYHTGHIWKLLVSLGWSCQRPAGRALQRDEERIREWKQKAWPRIKKSAAGRADDRLPRRKWRKPTAARVPDLVAAGGRHRSCNIASSGRRCRPSPG